jgi:uncharacterized protein
VSFATLTGTDALPAYQVPIFIVNAAVIGLVWGQIRALSGSIVASSVSHGIWNGAAYVLCGAGGRLGHGALGITATAIFGVEIGVAGLAMNVIFAAALWWWRSRQPQAELAL